VIDKLIAIVLDTEPELRTALRLSLETSADDERGATLRKGRAIGWIEDALTLLRDQLPRRELRRLVLAIRSAVGIEPLVWLTDVAGLSREQAADVMRWSARALFRSALADPPGDG
jgi:hypothetical protein